MILIEVVGMIAGFLTTVSFLPQVIKTIKTKSTGDISYLWIITLVIGIAIWVVYGFLILSLPVILANIFSFLFAAVILIYKIIYH